MGWALRIDKTGAKAGKDTLKAQGWLDSTRKSTTSCGGSKIEFPVTMDALQHISSLLNDKCACCNGTSVPCPLAQLAYSGASLVESGQFSVNPKFSISPALKLKIQISSMLEQRHLPSSLLLQDIPTKWEKIGDLGILSANTMKDEAWSSFGASIWEIIANCIGVSRLARQGPVSPCGTRDSTLEMLLGDNGWVEHRENGILYCFDATKCMFSSGNVTERSRMGRLNCTGEVVVDLFAGIGYFVLPFLLRARAKHVYACEWNPHALYSLRWNLRVNQVDEFCTVIEGDNRTTAPQGVADRVCLGLLPSSEGSWEVAVKALRLEGGILHVHENVKDTDEQKWIEYLLSSLQTLATSQGRRGQVRVLHIEHVKWYAPHIRHIVVDCELQ